MSDLPLRTRWLRILFYEGIRRLEVDGAEDGFELVVEVVGGAVV